MLDCFLSYICGEVGDGAVVFLWRLGGGVFWCCHKQTTETAGVDLPFFYNWGNLVNTHSFLFSSTSLLDELFHIW